MNVLICRWRGGFDAWIFVIWVYWLAFEELKLTDLHKEFLLVATYPYYGNLA